MLGVIELLVFGCAAAFGITDDAILATANTFSSASVIIAEINTALVTTYLRQLFLVIMKLRDLYYLKVLITKSVKDRYNI